MKIYLTAILSVFYLSVFAQRNFSSDIQKKIAGEGYITIYQNVRLTHLLNGDTVLLPSKENDVVKREIRIIKKEDKTGKDDSKETLISGKSTQLNVIHKESNDDITVRPPHPIKVRKYKISGYRVQIFAGSNSRSSRQEAEKAGIKFKDYFPEIPVYTHFYPPRWVCRVGNFKTEAQARSFMSQISQLKVFRGLTVVKSAIQIISREDE